MKTYSTEKEIATRLREMDGKATLDEQGRILGLTNTQVNGRRQALGLRCRFRPKSMSPNHKLCCIECGELRPAKEFALLRRHSVWTGTCDKCANRFPMPEIPWWAQWLYERPTWKLN